MVVWVELDDAEEDEALVELTATAGIATAAAAFVIIVVVVVVVVVLDPATHFPFTRINPSLLGQLLQATPPSLYVKAYVLSGHAAAQNPPFTMFEAPQLRHCCPGACPKAT